MSCSKCGAAIPEGAAFCPACGHPAISFTPPVPDSDASTPVKAVVYAGFWLRLVAYFIDTATISIAMSPFLFTLFLRAGLINSATGQPFTFSQMMQQRTAGVFAVDAIIFVIVGLYFSLMESSPWQATLGKRVLGIIVTDLEGRRISFGRATARYFAKLVSGFTFGIGYLIAGFTIRKQALHDIITDCLVIKKT